MFQSAFVATHINDDDQLIYTSGYVHSNVYAAFLVNDKGLWTYPWSSLPDYLGLEPKYNFLNKRIVLSLFDNSSSKYKNYISRQLGFYREKIIVKNS